MAAVAVALGGLDAVVGNAGISSYRMAVTPAHLQGRIGSTSQFTSMSVMPLAPLLGGYLMAAKVALPLLFAAYCVPLLLCAACVAGVRRLSDTPPSE